MGDRIELLDISLRNPNMICQDTSAGRIETVGERGAPSWQRLTGFPLLERNQQPPVTDRKQYNPNINPRDPVERLIFTTAPTIHRGQLLHVLTIRARAVRLAAIVSVGHLQCRHPFGCVATACTAARSSAIWS